MGYTGILHTKSDYAFKEIGLNFEKRGKSAQAAAINRLKSMEQKLYAEFGCNDYESFIEVIRSLFGQANIEVLQRFRPEYLQKELARFENGYGTIYNQEVHFTVNLTNKAEINLDSLLKIPGSTLVSKNGDEITVGFIYNKVNVKTFLNILRDKGRNKKFFREFKISEDGSMEIAERRLAILGTKGMLSITTKNPQTGAFEENFKISEIKNYPWGVTKSIYEDAVATNSTDILEDFKRAAIAMKNFICGDLCQGATPLLQKAVKETWDKNFGPGEQDPVFFFRGTTTGNFASAVQGNLGEFQAGVIFTYLAQQIGKNSSYSKLIGDKLLNGEKMRTDVSIIQNLGLQVKNITEFTDNLGKTHLIRDLETGIHPDKLAFYLNNPQNFLDYISNYFFNKTFATETASTYNKMIEMLGTYLGEVMNFTMSENIQDTVCFYFIGGKYLVPVSRILEAEEELNLKDSLRIESGYSELTDEQFTYPFFKRGKRKIGAPLYIEYWNHPPGNNKAWKVTNENTKRYNQLNSHYISIRTAFNLIDEIKKYALF